jgi:alpha-beta hydrolase superfamily lysophospholipase
VIKYMLAAAAAVVLVLVATAAHAASPQPGPIDETGTLNGAPYRIIVPASWNGGLVVLAHGYRDRADHAGEVDDRRPMDTGFSGIAAGLAAQGYAVAASAYKTNGWAVSDELDDTVALTSYFRDTIAKPNRTLLVGFSLGSFTAKLNERGAGLFDGYGPWCGVLAGAPRAWDGGGVNLLAYATAFGGLPASWGTTADGDDDVDFETEVLPILFGQILNPANFGKFEFMRLVSGVPQNPSYYPSGLFTNAFFFTEARGELERRAGGPIVSNVGHVYRLSEADKAYLAGLGVTPSTTTAWLAQMNATRFTAPATSRNYVEQYADFTGKIKKPVLTLHTKDDTLVPIAHESAYKATVDGAGESDLLFQVATNGSGHCAFTPAQIFTGIGALDQWVQTGVRPTAAQFPSALGFDTAFTPPTWPQP